MVLTDKSNTGRTGEGFATTSLSHSFQIQCSLGLNTVSAIVAVLGTIMIILKEIFIYEDVIGRSSYGSLFIVSMSCSFNGNL